MNMTLTARERQARHRAKVKSNQELRKSLRKAEKSCHEIQDEKGNDRMATKRTSCEREAAYQKIRGHKLPQDLLSLQTC